jgi:hypothetical protein
MIGMEPMDLGTCFTVIEGLVREPLDDRLLLYDPNGGMIVDLNSSAGLIVELCDGQRSVAELQKLIADAFPDSAGDVEVDVPILIAELVDDGILKANESR